MSKSQVIRTRIRKSDAHNFEIETYKEVISTSDSKDGTRKKGDSRWEWVGGRFYGHNLAVAAEFALLAAMPDGEVVTPSMVKAAVKTIVNETRSVMR